MSYQTLIFRRKDHVGSIDGITIEIPKNPGNEQPPIKSRRHGNGSGDEQALSPL